MRARLDALLSRLPAVCEVCGAWPAQPVCAPCALRFAPPTPRCAGCALPVAPGIERCGRCLREPAAFDACLAALPYAYPWSGLIGRFKFRNEPHWASTLAQLMRQAPGIGKAVSDADLILPLPLSGRRLAERGFNQSAEIARRLAPAKLAPRTLLRTRDTAPQARLDRDERFRNVARAFAVDPRKAGTLRGRGIVIVDDVMTSGASMQAAADAVRRAGAARVTAVVLARTDAS
jgi:ComF family protein